MLALSSGCGDEQGGVFGEPLPPPDSFPFVEDFESGALADCWSVSTTGTGRIVVATTNFPNTGTHHLLMDSSVSSSYALNELVLTIDLAGQSGVMLSFYCKEFQDESEVMPLSFVGSSNSDGVAVSADGVNWFRAVDLASAVTTVYQRFDVDLDALCLANGISYNGTFMIKFQQYDNNPITMDGFAFDDIALTPPSPPVIVTHPADATVTEPATAFFNVFATGLALTYQWQKDGVDIAGATGSSYVTPPTTLADDGARFTCAATNAFGSVTSNQAVLAVSAAPPSIITQPVDQSTYENETAAFTIVAAGSAPLTFQWRKDGLDIPGAAASSYTTPAVTPADDGVVFTCVVTSPYGTVTSFPATLTVMPPYITVTSPNGGETWYFEGLDESITWTSGGVAGNVDIDYSTDGGGTWSAIATNVADTGSWTWTIPDEDSANCLVRVQEAGGGPSDESDTAFTILPLPRASFPFTEDFETGTLANVWSTDSTGNGRIMVATTNFPNTATHHLLMDSSVSSSYALNELVLTIDLAGQSGVMLSFYCKDFGDEPEVMPLSFVGSSNSDGVAISADGVNWFRAVDLASMVTGTYQLFEADLDAVCAANGISVNSTFRIKFQQYDNYAITTDGFAFDDIGVDVAPPPTITVHPSDATVPENETATFSVGASGYGILNYQWQLGGVDIPSATGSSYTTPVTTPAHNGAVFTCVVTNGGGSVTSNAAVLTVIPPYITVNAPNGGETWYFDGPDEAIVWTTGGVTGNVDIQYSVNGGGTWSAIATNVADTGSWTWTIPDENSANCLVRVQETGGGGASDLSDAPFAIAPATLSVVAPNGGESWGTGSTQSIQWTSAGVVNVKIELSRDNGTSWIDIAASTPAAAGSLPWFVTEPDSPVCLVRVSDAADAAPADDSDAVFSIDLAVDHFDFSTVPSPQDANISFPVTVTAKSIGGSTVTGFTGTVALSGTNEVPRLTETGTGALSWDYPLHTYYHDARTQVIYRPGEIGGPMTVDVLSLDVTSLPGQTMNGWTIRMKHTALNDYLGTAQWEGAGWTVVYQGNETVSTTGWVTFNFATPFEYNGVDNLMVDFSFNNSSWTSSGSCRYTASAQPRTIYYYTDSGYGNPLTWSGTTNPMPLTSTYVPNIRLTGTAGAPFGVVPAVTGAFAAGEWTGNVAVPGATLDCELLADDGSGHTGRSNAFDVNGFRVTSPNGSETWYEGSTETITWDSVAMSGNVDILYSVDDGTSWTPVATDILDTGSFDWLVPPEDSALCLVRVQETGGVGASDDSDAVFTISPPTINVTNPNGGETWYQDLTKPVTWNSLAVTSNVDVLYSIDDGTSWAPIATDIADSGSLNWLVPFEDSALCLVRVQETGGGGASDDSDVVFTIGPPPPPVIVTHPMDETVAEPGTAFFSVFATGLALTYQWQKDGVDIAGAMGSSYLTPPTTLADDGSLFTCVVTNGGGSVTSFPATLWVNAVPPSITTQPVDQTAAETDAATFAVVATGSAPLSYQWRRDGVDIPAAAAASYTTPLLAPADDGAVFDCIVANIRGSVTSFPATLTVVPPYITVSSPNGGETWYFEGLDESITWASGGVTGNVDIHYSVNGGGAWTDVAINVPDAGSYTWTIPDESSANCLVRVQETGGGGLSDESDAVCTIIPLPRASFPFTEDFETGTLANVWSTDSTGNGRIIVATTNFPYTGTYHVLMDTAGGYSLNELVLTIDLAGQSGVMLSFYCKDFGDEPEVMPLSFVGSSSSDGVAVSADGVNWFRAVDLASMVTGTYQLFEADLDAVCAANGISFNSTFRIKFQQYDDYAITTDGFAFDDISVAPPP